MGIYLSNIKMPKDRGVYIAIDIDGQVYTKPLGALEWQHLDQKAAFIPSHEKLLKVLKTERECVSQDCNRDCEKCNLSLERDEILSAYDTLIALFADQIKEGEK